MHRNPDTPQLKAVVRRARFLVLGENTLIRRFTITSVPLLIGCLLTHPYALAHLSVVSSQREFRPYGYFSLIGKPPKGFESFDTIQYWKKSQEQSGPDISERLSGVNLSGGRVYRYASVSVNRKNFGFTTKKIRGVSFSFQGRFLRTDFLEEGFDMDRPVVEGKLRKYLNGKKVAEANVRLSYFAGT
ncbi:MAG TPA: hypothetical protein VJU86_06340 [Pyrinomonadaceae bacterium]|nr:hypothetical protein [Pyrinomonadaceae bacterium]